MLCLWDLWRIEPTFRYSRKKTNRPLPTEKKYSSSNVFWGTIVLWRQCGEYCREEYLFMNHPNVFKLHTHHSRHATKNKSLCRTVWEWKHSEAADCHFSLYKVQSYKIWLYDAAKTGWSLFVVAARYHAKNRPVFCTPSGSGGCECLHTSFCCRCHAMLHYISFFQIMLTYST